MDVSRHAEISWVDNFVCRWVIEDCLGVNTSLVSEGTKSGNGVVEAGIGQLWKI